MRDAPVVKPYPLPEVIRARISPALRSEGGDFMEIGYLLAAVFFGRWLVFKLIEATKDRNKKKDTDNKDR